MRDKFIQKVLPDFFSPSSKKDWEKTATQEMQGKNPFEILSWRGNDGILFLPYYDSEDLAHLDFLKGFQMPAADPHRWTNLPPIQTSNDITANTLALNHLSFGVDGILFDVRKQHNVNCTRLLRDILWPHCTLSFKVDQDNFIHDLTTVIKNNFEPEAIDGALFWESIPKNNSVEFYLKACRNLKSLGLTVPETTPAHEIASALIGGVQIAEAFKTTAPDNLFSHIAFSMPANALLIETVAKLKALRMLWFQVVQAYGIKDYKPSDLHIHVYSSRVADGVYGPHENMLKGTFAAIGAVAGGCNSLSVESEAQPPFVPRHARNISAVLREESFFGHAADPFAGSYAVESITNAIAEKAWSMFQEKWQPR
jgi:methylmalonyl-CoA mutase